MTTNKPLDAMRVMTLVTDAMSDVVLGIDCHEAARQMITRRRPTVRELEAARRESLELFSGGIPDILTTLGFAASPPPPKVLQLRRTIDDYLSIAASLARLSAGQGPN